MDRRTVIAVVLMLGLWMGFMVLRPMIWPPEVPTETDVPMADAGAAIDATDSGSDGLADAGDAPVTDGGSNEPAAAAPSAVPERSVDWSACGMDGTLTSEGGYLRSASLGAYEGPYDVTPIYMYVWGLVSGGETTWSPYGGPPGPQPLASERARLFGMGSGAYGTSAADVLIEERDDGTIVMRGTTVDGIRIERELSIKDLDTCLVEVKATWTNAGDADYDGAIWLQMHDDLPVAKSSYDHAPKPYWGIDDSSSSYFYPQEGGMMGLYSELSQPTPYDGNVDWFGLTDGYFSVVAVPDGPNNGRLVLSPIQTGQTVTRTEGGEAEALTLYGHHYVIDGLAAGATATETFTVYMGPNNTDVLSEIHPTLYYLVDLGWFAFFGRPLLWLLNLYYSFIGDWGLSIILLTFTIKLAFFPLTQMAYKSSQRMASLQPQLKEIREKFADNQEELNKRTMALFRENKVNPIGGCLPMLLQAPIWISLYRVLLTSVDLYHTEFLYLKDLSVADPYAILPLIVMGLMFAQQQLMPTSASMDPNQARIMKFMPLVIGFLFFTFPSGLVLYIFVNTTLTIIQQWFIKRRFGSGGNGPPAPAPTPST